MSDLNPLRISRVAIDGLFRLYNHDIPLRLQDRVTILHGPNGRGKTVLLRMLQSLFRMNFAEIARVPFDELRVSFDDGSTLFLTHSEAPSTSTDRAGALSIHLDRPGPRDEAFDIPVMKRPPESNRLSPEVLLSLLGGAEGANERDVAASVERVMRTIMAAQQRPKVADWFKALCDRVRVHFVETQRLLQPTPAEDSRPDDKTNGKLIPTVAENARDLARRTGEVMARYAAVSQSLDRSFPQRLIQTNTLAPLSLPDLTRRLDDLEKKRRKLQLIGLLTEDDNTRFDPPGLTEAQRAVLTLYVFDSEQKLAVYDEIADRVALLLNIINKKFSAKTLRVDRRRGYFVVGHDGRALPPDALSSGEQHELVLLYNLLFRVEPGALLLLDEPELSLHVAWQTEFLGDLIQIARRVGFDALVATHSPYVVGDRWDLTVELGAPPA